jgi:hypothetical protein
LETSNVKKEKTNDMSTKVLNNWDFLCANDTTMQIDNNLTINCKYNTKIRSAYKFEILGGSAYPLTLYAESGLDLIGKEYAKLSSMSRSVELNSPSSVDAQAPVLRYLELETGLGYRAPKPPSPVMPLIVPVDPPLTKDYMQNNKKQWTPTNSKK